MKYTLITPKTVADILGVTEGTICVWRSTNRYKLPFVKVGKHKVMYRLEDVQDFINRNTKSQTP